MTIFNNKLLKNRSRSARYLAVQPSNNTLVDGVYKFLPENTVQFSEPGGGVTSGGITYTDPAGTLADYGIAMGYKIKIDPIYPGDDTRDEAGHFLSGHDITIAGSYYNNTKRLFVWGTDHYISSKTQDCFIFGNDISGSMGPYSGVFGMDHILKNDNLTGSFMAGVAHTISGGAKQNVMYGHTNFSSRDENALIGGSGNTATEGHNNGVVIGRNQVCDANNATGLVMFGDANKMTNNTPFSLVHGQYVSGNIQGAREMGGSRHLDGSGVGIQGSIQMTEFMMGRVTADATGVPLHSMINGGGAQTRPPIIQNQSVVFTADVVGRRKNSTETCAYLITGAIKNDAGTTALVGTPTINVVGEDAAAWDVSVQANNTNDTLEIMVTGAAGSTVYWVATVRFTQTIIGA